VNPRTSDHEPYILHTFENADDTDDDPFIGEDLHGEVYSVQHLACSLDLLHTVYDDLERKKLAQFVRYVERRIVERVPIQRKSRNILSS